MEQSFNLAEQVLSAAKLYPDRIAYHRPRGTVTYRRMGDSILSYAARMRELGIGRDARVCITGIDQVSEMYIALACALLGCSYIFGSTAVLGNDKLGITHFVHDGGPPVAVAGTMFTVDQSWLPRGSIGAASFEGFASGDAIASIVQSSGTTGARKFMAVSASAQWRRLNQHASAFDYLDGCPPVVCSFMPPLSVYGMEYVIKPLIMGGSVVTTPALDLVKIAGVTTFVGSPVQYMQWCERFPLVHPKILCAVVGGAQCSERLFDILFERFELVQHQFGCSELGRIAFQRFGPDEKNRVSVGKPLPSVQVQIVDANDLPLPRGEGGILRLRSDAAVSGYIGERGLEAFGNRWFYTGDTAVLSAEGDLTITGRTNDLLNFGGIKKDANALDEVIVNTDGVKDGACFTQSDFSPIAELALMIVPKDSARIEKIVERVRGNLVAKFGELGKVQRCYIVDTIPRNENGKTARHLLVELAAKTPFERMG